LGSDSYQFALFLRIRRIEHNAVGNINSLEHFYRIPKVFANCNFS